MQAAVRDQKHLPTRLLAIDNPGHVYARLADDVAAQLDDHARLGQLGSEPRQQLPQVRPDPRQIQGLVVGKVGDSESAAHVQVVQRGGCVLGQRQCKLDRLALCVAQGIGVQVLRPGEDVEAREVQVETVQLAHHLRHALGVDTELLRAAAHAHARRFELEVRINADRDPRPGALLLRDVREQPHLAF